MSDAESIWFSIRLTPDQRRRLEVVAEQYGVSEEDAVVQIVQAALAREMAQAHPVPQPGSFLEGIQDLIGSVEDGPTDLSTNPRHMEGFGR